MKAEVAVTTTTATMRRFQLVFTASAIASAISGATVAGPG